MEEAQETSQDNKRRHDGRRIQKETTIKETLDYIERGVYEVYRFAGGQSGVWDDFVKIRKCNSHEHVDFVQCIECKGLLSFKLDSGTSHLLRHKCPKEKANDGDGGDIPKFRCLPLDKIVQTRRSIANDIVKCCTSDLFSCEAICDSKNFLSFCQSFVSYGYKHGCIDLRNVFPSSNYVNRFMVNFKEEKLQEISNTFRDCVKKKRCSVTIETQNICSSMQRINTAVVVGVQYFEKDLAVLNKKFCFSFVLSDDETADSFLVKFIKHFNTIGGDKNDLQTLKIVTPNEELFSSAFPAPISRTNCVADAITKILNEAFRTTPLIEKYDTLSNCRRIVKYVNHSENSNFKLKEDDGSWNSKMFMVQSIIENYDGVMKLLDDGDQDLQFNKRKAEEILLFIEPFVEAIDDLAATNYSTANKVLLWHGALSDHFQNEVNCNVELKRIRSVAKEIFESTFCPTLDNKVDCFLDPRYKYLKMLTDVETSRVVAEVRRLLDALEVNNETFEAGPSSATSAAKKNRFTNFEAVPGPKNKEKQKKTSRFARFEINNEELEEMDEVDIYLKLPGVTSSSFPTEFDVIRKFWKQQKNKLPKLYNLVTTRLHVPACSGNTVPRSVHQLQDLDSHTLANYLFVKNNL